MRPKLEWCSNRPPQSSVAVGTAVAEETAVEKVVTFQCSRWSSLQPR